MQSERIWGCAEQWSWNRVLQFFRKTFPERQFAEDIPWMGQSLTVFEGGKRANDLLNESFGNGGFESFEEAVWDNVKAFAGPNAIDLASVKIPYNIL